MEPSSQNNNKFLAVEANASQTTLQVYPPSEISRSPSPSPTLVSTTTTNPSSSSSKPYSTLTARQKWVIIFMIAFGGLWSPLTANIYNPVVPTLAKEMKVSQELINLTITSYMIFQAITPTFIGDFADNVGRRPAYLVSFGIYMVANLGLAFSNSFPMLLALRCLQSMGSSGTVSILMGVVADIANREERGTYMGFAYCGPMLAPGFGPVLGGILANYLGWRSIFWFLAAGSGASFVLFAIFFPETSRNVVGNGSAPSQSWNRPLLRFLEPAKDADCEAVVRKNSAFPNPLRSLSLLRRLDVFLILLATGGIYAAFKCILTATSSLLDAIYHLNPLQIGLSYLPNGISGFVASIITGKLIDWNYNRLKQKAQSASSSSSLSESRENDIEKSAKSSPAASIIEAAIPVEHARISIVWFLLPFAVIPCVGFGWTFVSKVHLAAPLALIFVNGFAVTGIISCASTLLLDLCPDSPSSVGAVLSFSRCLVGALGSGVVGRMQTSMGVGWCFTLWGILSALFCLPFILLEVNASRRRRSSV